jgi:hypothetical protein
MQRFFGESGANVTGAIELYEEALAIYIREPRPTRLAETQYKLAMAHLSRDRTDNLDQAIELLEAALLVLSRETSPHTHLLTSCRLGELLMEKRDWEQTSRVLTEARATFLLLFRQIVDETEARGLIEAAGGLFASAAYAAVEMGRHREALDLCCEGKARLLATALRLQQINLPPSRLERLEAVRIEMREHSRVLEMSTGSDRLSVLDRLGSLRRELSGLMEEGEVQSRLCDALTLAQPLVTDGSALVVPVVTAVGGKLLVVTSGPVLSVIDLPGLTSARLNALMHGDKRRNGWLSAFAGISARRDWGAARIIETPG